MTTKNMRTRSHEWLEPTGLADRTRLLSGQEYLKAWSNGELVPPIAATLGFTLQDFGEGHVEISLTPEEFHYNPYGTVHGGLAATYWIQRPVAPSNRHCLRGRDTQR